MDTWSFSQLSTWDDAIYRLSVQRLTTPIPRAAAAPPVVAPPPGNPRFPHFDGLRAIAALSVLALHSAVYTDYFRGWEGAYARQLAAGVTVFFLISGFLLYRPFVAARIGGRPPIELGRYMRRRVLRIVPAYWLALTLLALYPGLPGHPLSASHWLRYYGFAQDYDGSTLFDGLGTAWSLGTEVTFYLVLPVYAFILARPRFNRTGRASFGWDLGALALLSLGSFFFRYLVYGSHPNLGYTLPGTFDWFALGMALAIVSVLVSEAQVKSRVVTVAERYPTLCWMIAFAILTLAAAYWERTLRYDAYSAGPLHVVWGLLAFFLLLPAVFNRGNRGLPHRFLSVRLIGWLGIISYGIYLWHLPLVPKIGHLAIGHFNLGSGLLATVVVFTSVALVTVACAAASYYVVERPILRFKERRTKASAPGVVAINAEAKA